MQCSRCNWQNQASYTHCFSCGVPLPGPGAHSAAPAPGAFQPARAPAPAQPRQEAGAAEVFPHGLARLGATLIDGVAMLALPMALVLAWVFARPAFDIAPGATYPAALALGLLGLLAPALMDALGRGSPGKRVLSMRVATRTGGRPGIVRSVLRHFLKYTLTLGLTLAVPFLLHRLLTAVFGERGLHSSMTGTFVVASRASDAAILEAVAGYRGPGWFLKGLVMLGAAAALGIAALVAVVLWNRGDGDGPAHPQREMVRQLDGAARPVLRLVENHYQRTGAFPQDAAAIGLAQAGQLPAGFKALRVEPANGVVRLTIGAQASGDGATLDGRHLVYTPLLRTRGQQTDIRKWQCGSDDIAPGDRPFSCRHAVAGSAK